mgnify:CR=1 FL=1
MKIYIYLKLFLLLFFENIIFANYKSKADSILQLQKDFIFYANDDELSERKIFGDNNVSIHDSVFNVSLKFLHQMFSQSPKNMASLLYYGKFKDIFFLIEPMVTNKIYGKKILGTDYNRRHIAGRFQKSYININKPHYNFYFGRYPIKWGESAFSSIIQSGLYPAYDNTLISFELGKFRYELLAGTLSSKKNEYGHLIKRYISGKRVSIDFNKRYSISAGEQIIYTGENRQFSMRYLNPFMPYFLTGLEDIERDSRFDNDNSMLFFHHKLILGKGSSSIYNEFIIDDYQIDESGLRHALGLKLGYDNIFKIKKHHVFLVAEYTNISKLTYRHHGQFTSWQNLEHNIGSPLGCDIEGFQLKIFTKSLKNRILNLEFDYLIKGGMNTNSPWIWGDILQNNESYKKYIFIKLGLTFIKKWGFIEIASKPINQLNSMITNYDELNGKNEITVNFVYNIKKSINIFKI